MDRKTSRFKNNCKTIVITPTGARPKAIKHLNHCLENQTFQNFKWIVLDDCEPRIKKPARCDEYVNPDWIWQGDNTQSKAMIYLLNMCTDQHKIFICEDDDFYLPGYIETFHVYLDKYDLVGQKNSIYYNIKNRTHKTMLNQKHCSMSCSAIKGKARNILINICKQNKSSLDVKLWSKIKGLRLNKSLCIGMKGLPGRSGIGIGHRIEGIKDKNHAFLRHLIGEYYTEYK